MREKIKKIVLSIFSLYRIKNIILLESVPDFTDSSKMLFDYLIKNNFNKKYKIYWLVNDKNKFVNYQYDNVKFIECFKNNSLISKLRIFNLSKHAKFIITCNRHVPKYNRKSIYLYLTHGMPLKNIKCVKMVTPMVDYVLSSGKYWDKLYSEQFKVDIKKVLPLGIPRYDSIFTCKKPNIKLDFISDDYKKILLWLPTFRQHKNKQRIDVKIESFYGLPIIYNERDLVEINEYLVKNKMLLLLKMHPAQDLSKIKELNSSNIKFITDDDLFRNKIILSELLFYIDAIITDYSGVLYDSLAMDKMTIFAIDDIKEYMDNRGFMDDDPYKYMIGEKVKNKNELIKAFDDVLNNNDKYKEERKIKRELFFDYEDNDASKRIIEYFKF